MKAMREYLKELEDQVPRKLFEQESEQLHLSPQFKSLRNHFVPSMQQ